MHDSVTARTLVMIPVNSILIYVLHLRMCSDSHALLLVDTVTLWTFVMRFVNVAPRPLGAFISHGYYICTICVFVNDAKFLFVAQSSHFTVSARFVYAGLYPMCLQVPRNSNATSSLPTWAVSIQRSR